MAVPTRATTLCLLLLLSAASQISGQPEGGCAAETERGCRNKTEALKYKIIALFAILVASVIGVSMPILTRGVASLQPDKNAFTIVKALASGVILATGYMHVLPDSFEDLRSECLPEDPWRKFPFTTFVAMLSAMVTLMVDSFGMALYKKKSCCTPPKDLEMQNRNGNSAQPPENHDTKSNLLRYRVVAQVLELGIVVHSVVIGLGMGASDNPCTIRPLIAALCFHQLFEGMGLGGCILQAEYKWKTNAVMVFFFAATTPFGIALGIALSNVYSEDSPTALIVVGLLNACSAGLLNYMALVDLLAADFMGPKLQADVKLQVWAYMAVFVGAGGMALMAKWA